MCDTPKTNTIVCEEVFDESSVPSEEEIIEYAKTIGIDPNCESHLLPIARNGLMHPLPPEWKPCYDPKCNRVCYFNSQTGEWQWKHPLDKVFQQMVRRGRSEGYSSAAEDDSKTAAKEELKSFEEVSDILSSRSNDIKIEDIPDMADKGKNVSTRSHQPLLLRRKQLQSGADPIALQVAKVMNSTMKESNLMDLEKFNNISVTPFKASDTVSHSVNTIPMVPKQMQPLRRAHTLDPIPLVRSSVKQGEAPPIKGILRESSFSGFHSRNLARLNSVQGELQVGGVDVEDEKKRSVRFADSERKALDIRFEFSDTEESVSEENVGSGSSSPEEVPSEEHSPEDDAGSSENNEKKSVNRISNIPESLNIFDSPIEPIDPNKMKHKLLSRQAIVAPLKIDIIGNNSDNEESPSSNDKGSLTADSDKLFLKPEIKTSRFTVSAVKEDLKPLDSPTHTEKVEENVNSNMNDLQLTVSNTMNSAISSGSDLVKEDNDYETIPKEMEDMARIKAAEKLAVFEEKLTKEIQDKIVALKKQQRDTLAGINDNLVKLENEEKQRLNQESELKLAELKRSLNEELERKESEIRRNNEIAIEELVKKLEENRKTIMEETRTKHKEILSKLKEDEELKFNEEKIKLDKEFDLEVVKRKEIFQSKLDSLKKEEEDEVNKMKTVSGTRLQELEEKYKNISNEEEQKFQMDIRKLEEEFQSKLNELKVEKESEMKRVQTEWEDKITATTLQHKSALESAMTDHESSMQALRAQFQHEEDDLKRYHAEQIEAWNHRLKKLLEKEPSSIGQINRDYEKIRCEKRLIEDKYRSLKDKYLQLKTDMKVAVERKLQSRARKKRENLGFDKDIQEDKDASKYDRSKNNHSDRSPLLIKSPLSKVTPRIVEPTASGRDHSRDQADNDPSSDDQYVSTSLSLTLPTEGDRRNFMSTEESERRRKHGRVKGRTNDKSKDRQGNVLDDVRTQLQELEEIEEQIPANSQGDTYLRYPFHGPGLSTSAEVDFYRHRVIVEQEAVRAARECLLQQKRELEARQSILRTNNNTSTMQQLQQQERDLTEMEVSLHRTRALLGEKMIRLRLLGQTLNRLVDDTPENSNTGSAEAQLRQGNITGFPYETVPFNVLQNLENINSEIREIWSQLSKQQNEGTATALEQSTDQNFKPIIRANKSPLVRTPKATRRSPSSRAEIEARIQGLREWLQKPQPPGTDWNQLTL